MSRPTAAATRHARTVALTSAAVITGLGTVAWAQATNDQSGPQGRISASQQLVWEDDRDLYGVTALSAEIQAQTRIQTLRLKVSGNIEEEFSGNNSGLDLDSPEARLSYTRDGAQSGLSLGLGYKRSDIDRLTYDEDGEFLTLEDGTATSKSATLGLEFGKESKFGGALNLSHLARDYSGGTNSDLDDYVSDNAGLTLNFQISPLLTLSTVASRAETRKDDPNDLDSRTIRAGATAKMQIDQRTSAQLGVYHMDIRRENATTSATTRGLSYLASLEREVPLGSWGISATSDLGTAGRRDTLRFSRSLETPRAKITLSAGATRLEDSDWEAIYSLSYRRDIMRDANLAVRLTRASTQNSDGDEALNTSLSASYSQPLTENARINAQFGYRRTDVQTGSASDAERITFGMSYSQSLTRNWDLVAGYNGRRSKSGDSEDDDQKVYIGLKTEYLWRP